MGMVLGICLKMHKPISSQKKKMHKPTDHPIIGSLCWAIDADEAAAGGGPLENQRRGWGSST